MIKSGNRWFHNSVSALAYSFAQPHAQTAELRSPFNDLTQFILRQHARLPDYLRAPMHLATLGFDLSGILNGAEPFHRQTQERRARQINAWKNANSGFQRDLIRYFESLATLALYSRGQNNSLQPVRLGERRDEGSARIKGNVIQSPSSELRAGIVVIGSGPGGAITACLFAEAGRDVLLIEEGPFLPLESCAPFSQEEMEQKYRNGGQTVAFGGNKIAYVEGRCVGGGSEINSGLYHRTPPEMLERWRNEFDVHALSESDLAPHFEACERDLSVSRLPGPAPAASLKLHDAALRLGWKSLEIPRWFRYDAGPAETGKRQSMTETYVPRFLRAGGCLLPGTRANRLRQNGAAWIVEAGHHTAGTIRIAADTLFLCAGAVQSPALLRRSGITRNIGNSLQVHPTVKIIAGFPETVNAAGMGVPVHQVKEFSPRLSLGCSVSSPAYLALGLMDYPQAVRETARTWQNRAAYYAMITSEGSGTVRVLPGFRDPVVRYTLTANDRRQLGDGLEKLGQILIEAGATELFRSLNHTPVFPGYLDKVPQILPDGPANLITIHLFSSCPMGEDRARCATDSFGRVHGFKNLFINDASLLCTAPGVNPQGSIMALARRNTLRFLEKT